MEREIIATKVKIPVKKPVRRDVPLESPVPVRRETPVKEPERILVPTK